MLESFHISGDAETQRAATHLFLCFFCASSYFGILVMLSPLILKDIVGAEDAATWQGILTSVTAFAGLVLCSLIGYLSDRFGRVRMIQLWIVAFFLSSCAVLWAEVTASIHGLVFARVVPFSVAGALVYALASDIARDSSEVLRAHTFLGATFSGALLCGNVIAATLSVFFSRSAVLMFGSVCVGVAVHIAFRHLKDKVVTPTPATADADANDNEKSELVDIESAPKPKNAPEEDIAFLDGLILLRKDPLLRSLVFAFALIRCANVNTVVIFVIYVSHRWGWDIATIAMFMVSLGATGALAQALCVRYFNGLAASATANAHATANANASGGDAAGAASAARHQQQHQDAAGWAVLKLFFGLLSLAPIVCIGYGAAPSSALQFLLFLPAGICAIIPALFTSKIAALAKESGLVGFALGGVASLQNLIEMFLGVMFGKLLGFAIKHYDDDSLMFGLPYYVNSLFYCAVLALVAHAHVTHGVHREIWMNFSTL